MGWLERVGYGYVCEEVTRLSISGPDLLILEEPDLSDLGVAVSDLGVAVSDLSVT